MTVILDSSALVALVNDQDADHARALAVRDAIAVTGDQILLPYEVLAETLNVLGKKLNRSSASVTARVLIKMHKDGEISLVDPALLVVERAAELLPRATGSPSFVDCLVMAYADEYGTPHVFGFDATFRKNGYLLPGQQTSVQNAAGLSN